MIKGHDLHKKQLDNKLTILVKITILGVDQEVEGPNISRGHNNLY